MNREHVIVQMLLRSWPFPRGGGAGLIVYRLFSGLQFSEDVVEVPTTDGFAMSVMPNEVIGREIYLTGQFDRSVVRILCKFARPGDTLLDVGANIGYVSACFLAKVAGSRVIAVEPQPGVLDLLRKNLAQFEGRHRILPVALSDRDGFCNFYINQRNRGACRLVGDGERGHTLQVETWSVDRMMEFARPPRIDLVKLDTEGHEEQIISALEPVLREFRPRAVLFEDPFGKSAPNRPIGAVLQSVGYDIFGLRKSLARLRLVPIRREADCVCTDYVALMRR